MGSWPCRHLTALFRRRRPVLIAGGALALAVCFGWAAGSASQAEPAATPGGMVHALPGLPAQQMAKFERGRALFQRSFTPTTGLGPMFNAASCLACHGGAPSMGSGSIEAITLVATGEGILQYGLPNMGGPNIARHAIAGIPQPCVPSDATVVSTRITPVVWGLGLLEAVPAEAIEARTRPERRRGELKILGRINRIRGEIGRLGWKCQLSNTLDFTVQACQMEMGLSSPYRTLERFPGQGPVDLEDLPRSPDPKRPWVQSFFAQKVAAGVPASRCDLTRDEVDELTAFQRYLAPPPRANGGLVGKLGELAFSRVGCNECHTPMLTTGPNDLGVPAGLDVPAYSDLLIHNMGPDLADGIQQSEAGTRDWRTTPLWGLRFRQRFLHDGRTGTLDEAIQAHGGEATRVRENYNRLSEFERKALLTFLATL